MKHIRYWTGVLLVFVLGVLAGAVGNGVYLKHKLIRLSEGGPPGLPPPEMADFMARRMSRDLNLSAEQEMEIQKILIESHYQLRLISEKYQPEFLAVYEKARKAIRERLTREQAARMDDVEKRMRGRMQGPPPEGRPFGGPPHGPEPPPHDGEMPPDFFPPPPPRH